MAFAPSHFRHPYCHPVFHLFVYVVSHPLNYRMKPKIAAIPSHPSHCSENSPHSLLQSLATRCAKIELSEHEIRTEKGRLLNCARGGTTQNSGRHFIASHAVNRWRSPTLGTLAITFQIS